HRPRHARGDAAPPAPGRRRKRIEEPAGDLRPRSAAVGNDASARHARRPSAPPELELLSWKTMADRRAAFTGRDSFWLEGAVRAVMEARSCDAEAAKEIVQEFEDEGRTTLEFYRALQSWIGPRTLVDKTPSYALDPEILKRAEADFERPLYLHLLRHPGGMITSFEEAKLDQIFFRQEHSFSRRELAELIWLDSHLNILDLLAEVPAERQHAVRFEDLVREPEGALAEICSFLGIDPDAAMGDPYGAGSARMTDGPLPESRMLGDVKFLEHRKIDSGVAERWRERLD